MILLRGKNEKERLKEELVLSLGKVQNAESEKE